MIAPLAYDSWGEEEKAAIQSVMDSGRYTMGDKVREFEKAFARYIGVSHAVMVNSGSSANLLAVAAWKIVKNLPDGKCVTVPAVGWSTTYFPLFQNKFNVHVVDVTDTLNAPAGYVDMAVSVLGNPYEGVPTIHDCCESLGAEYAGQRLGAESLVATYSFFFSHHLQTMEGGMICTDNDDLAQVCRAMRAHGWTRDLPDKHFWGDKSPDPFEESFKFVCPGYSVRPLEMEGAVGLVQLGKLDADLERRRVNGKAYQEIFRDHPKVWIQKEVGRSSWFGFSFVLYDRNRKSVTDKLFEAGIECRPIVGGNILKQPVMQTLPYTSEATPIADQVHTRGFMIGCHNAEILQMVDDILRAT